MTPLFLLQTLYGDIRKYLDEIFVTKYGGKTMPWSELRHGCQQLSTATERANQRHPPSAVPNISFSRADAKPDRDGQRVHFSRAIENAYPLFIALYINRERLEESADQVQRGGGRIRFVNIAAIYSKFYSPREYDPPPELTDDATVTEQIYDGHTYEGLCARTGRLFHPCTTPVLEFARSSILYEKIVRCPGGVVNISFTNTFARYNWTQACNVSFINDNNKMMIVFFCRGR